jgi:hypothetical protein
MGDGELVVLDSRAVLGYFLNLALALAHGASKW